MSSPWQEARTADGKVYYYNVQTNATQWTKPVEMMSPAERALQDLPWKQHKAPDGRPYWYHTVTRDTTWQMPEDYKQALERTQQPHLPAAPTFVAGGTQNFGRENNERALTVGGHSFNDAGGESGGGMPRSFAAQFAGDRDEPQYSTIDEAEAAFIKLLRRNNVQADWTWDKTMRAIIKEPQYRALKDPKDRKAAFEKYIVELKQQEQEKAKDRIAKLRQDFSVMLKSHPEIKYYTRWKTARPIIEGETIFRSTSNEDERRQLFDEYIIELRNLQQEKDKKARREAMDELNGLLKSLELEPYTRWSEAQKIIQQNERFQSEEKFQALSQLDVLNAFESHIKVLERAFNDKRQRAKTMKMRKERKNREGFMELLNDLRSKGDIRAGTKWKHVYPLIKDDQRYINMLGQPGSTPLDLFWDMIEDVARDIRLKINLAMDVLDDRRVEIRESTTFEEFADLLRNDPRTASYDRETMNVLFEKLREKVVRRIEDDRHQHERHQRRRIDALRSAIKHLEPPVEPTDTYEKVLPRIKSLEEFRQLDSDDLRRTAFDKHMRRVKEKAEEKEKERERRDRDRDRDRHDKDRRHRRDESRNGHDSYHKAPAASRHHRSPRHLTRSPEPADPYEAERRRAARDRESQYSHRDRNHREGSVHRSDRGRSARAESRHRHERQESIYDRERREREEERERQYTTRSSRGDDIGPMRDEYRPPRRRRGMTPDDSDRDLKRSRRERSPRPRSPLPMAPRDRMAARPESPVINYGDDPVVDYGNDPYTAPPKPKAKTVKSEPKPPKEDKMQVDQKGEESEEGEIAE